MTKAEEVAFDILHILKHFTKQYPAACWNEEYRKLAEAIHSGTRDFEKALYENTTDLVDN